MKSWKLMDGNDCLLSMDGARANTLASPPPGASWIEVPEPAYEHTAEQDGLGGYTIVTRVKPLEELKVTALATVKALRDTTEAAGCTVEGIGRFETDARSQVKILGQVVKSMLTPGFTTNYRLEDDSLVPLNAAQMQMVGAVVGSQVEAAQYRKNELDDAINAAQDAPTLAAIPITEGWPS